MKKAIVVFLLLLVSFLYSCSSSPKYGEPVVKPEAILKNLMNFLVYRQKFLRLSEDFTAIDSASAEIDRGSFFKQLSTGRYLPLLLTSKDSTSYYQLYPINSVNKTDIQQTISQWGDHLYSLYQMEGKKLPGFNFIDLQNKTYNQENTKGKIVVVKCWFIGCVPCVKEMPALNELVKEYKNRNDILFISLAMDKKEPLEKFLKKTAFDYAVIPEQKNYMIDTLAITQYPTHLIVNEQGIITKVVNGHKELSAALRKQAVSSSL